VPGGPRKPPLTVAQILRWADAHRERTGAWPAVRSGPVEGGPGLTWRAVAAALSRGRRGLPGGDTLARLLHRERGAPRRRAPQRKADAREAARLRAEGLTLAEVGRRLGLTRQRVHHAVARGGGGQGTMTTQQVGRHAAAGVGGGEGRAVPRRRPPLTVADILRWADAYKCLAGRRASRGPPWRRPCAWAVGPAAGGQPLPAARA
jgi:hypothetical protein